MTAPAPNAGYLNRVENGDQELRDTLDRRAQIVLNAGEWDLSSPLAVACRSVTMVAVVLITMFALDSVRTTAVTRARPVF